VFTATEESFQGLLLRHRGRTGLTQRDLAARAGVSRRSIQDWEAALNYPEAQHLQALILAFLVRITVNSYSWNDTAVLILRLTKTRVVRTKSWRCGINLGNVRL
jgi:transcriptional regulator with XRE-family HTH domain